MFVGKVQLLGEGNSDKAGKINYGNINVNVSCEAQMRLLFSFINK